MTEKYNSFIQHLNAFIDKYYRNLLIKGGAMFLLLILLLVISISTAEYLGWFSVSVRRFLFFFALISTGFIFYYYVLIPLLRLFSLLPRITHRHASDLLNKSFPDIKDQIINILELREDHSGYDYSLINASIEQKIDNLKHDKFSIAIKYSSNRGIFYYLLSVVVLFLVLLVFKPIVLSVGAKRVLHYNTEFQKDYGYSILVEDAPLKVEKGKDLTVKFKVFGAVIPEQLFIKFGSNVYLLPSVTNGSTSFTFKAVNQSFSFYLFNDEYKTPSYNIETLNSPLLVDYKVVVNYPDYVDIEEAEFENLNEFSVPVGTRLLFKFKTFEVDTLILVVDSTQRNTADKRFGQFESELLVLKSFQYNVLTTNQFFSNNVLSGNINAIPDFFPSITVSVAINELNPNLYYFKGLISDDYGFTELKFLVNQRQYPVPIQKNVNQQEFFYSYEFAGTEGEDFQFYFEVSDNDGINGPKSSKSNIMKFTMPSYEQILKQEQQTSLEIEQKIDKGLLLAKELQRDIQEIQKSLLQENMSDWERKNQMEKLLEKNKRLDNLIKEISKENLKKDNRNNAFSEEQKAILEKQKALQEMFDNMMTDELKELMKQIEELQKGFDQQKFNELSKDLKLNYEELSKELDKNLELLNRYDIEKQVYDISEQLDKLSQNQDSLASFLSQQKADTAALRKQNEESIQDLETLKQSFDSVLVKNEALEKPMDLQDVSSDFENLSQEMQKNSDQMSKDQKSSSFDAKESSKKLKELSEKLDAMMSNSTANQEGENADNLRVLLENLFFVSFTQESINEQFRGLHSSDPKAAALTLEQKQLLSDFEIIRDSLYVLSKRTTQVGVHISQTAFNIENNLIWSNEALNAQNFGLANNYQRVSLEKTNDLILLLSESLKNMDNMGSGSGSSNKKKKKPQKGEPSLSDMRKSQESMKQQLEKMLNDMKKSQNQGGQQYNEQMGKMLAQQEMFQQMLNEMMNSNNSVGKETTKQLKEIQQMVDQNRRDIINKSITQNTLQRQHQIVTRLLEAEKSEMERDLDEQRESQQARDILKSNPENLFEDPNENVNFNELLYQNNLHLQPFYKIKYQEYLKEINSLEND